jgi:hypothetical protein
MIRRSISDKENLLEVARLTGDELTFEESWYWSMDGTRQIPCLDTTVVGDESDEIRFWSAFSAHGLVVSGHDDDGRAMLVRKYTDEDIVAGYKKP